MTGPRTPGRRAFAERAYLFAWDRTLITLSSDAPTAIPRLQGSSPGINVNGDSELEQQGQCRSPWVVSLFGELRTGGYHRRTGFYGDVSKDSARATQMGIHGRRFKFSRELPFTQWIWHRRLVLLGPRFTGKSAGVDFYIIF